MRLVALTRLERLERANGSTRVTCERVIYEADGRRIELEAYCDALGNRWAQRRGEPFEGLRERIEAEAVMAGGSRIARIMGSD